MSEDAEVIENEEQEDRQEDQQEQQEQEFDATAVLSQRESGLEERAKANGWKSLEQHVKDGGSAEDWRSAEAFLLYGEMQDTIKGFKSGYENKAANTAKMLNALHEQRMQELEDKFDNAVESGDADAIKKARKDISDHEKSAPVDEPVQQNDSVLDAWNRKNAGWINDGDNPKAVYAHAQWNQIMRKHGGNTEAGLAELDAKLVEKFPAQNRGSVPGSESGKNSGFKGKSRALTWSDLNEDERKVFETGVFGSDKDKFLKKAKDARDATEKANA